MNKDAIAINKEILEEILNAIAFYHDHHGHTSVGCAKLYGHLSGWVSESSSLDIFQIEWLKAKIKE